MSANCRCGRKWTKWCRGCNLVYCDDHIERPAHGCKNLDGHSEVMVEAKRKPLELAERLAETAVGKMAPLCVGIMIAGSIRRRSATAKDIEIVAIPRVEERNAHDQLFESPPVKVNLLWEYLDELCAKTDAVQVKGGERYKQIRAPYAPGAEMTLDIFLCEAGNWGWTSLVRTGSASFSHHIAGRLNKAGYTSRENWIRPLDDPERMIETPTEEDVFRLAGEEPVAPGRRSW
jgi:DNA polymerase/3'-5' exonuclease PolX